MDAYLQFLHEIPFSNLKSRTLSFIILLHGKYCVTHINVQLFVTVFSFLNLRFRLALHKLNIMCLAKFISSETILNMGRDYNRLTTMKTCCVLSHLHKDQLQEKVECIGIFPSQCGILFHIE